MIELTISTTQDGRKLGAPLLIQHGMSVTIQHDPPAAAGDGTILVTVDGQPYLLATAKGLPLTIEIEKFA